MTAGLVTAIRPGIVTIRLPNGQVITAKNALNVRTPPYSTVHVVETETGWTIVGRER